MSDEQPKEIEEMNADEQLAYYQAETDRLHAIKREREGAPMEYLARQEIEARAEKFAAVFGPDVIDTALAAADEAMFLAPQEHEDEEYRELLKKRCLYNVGAAFFLRAGYSFVVVNPD